MKSWMWALRAAVADALGARIGLAVGDVVGDRARPQVRVLTGKADAPTPLREIELGQRHAVDPNLTAGRVVDAAEQVHQGRLAGAGAADQGQRLAALDLEIDAVQRRAERAVATLPKL